jgi:hypothetical protein
MAEANATDLNGLKVTLSFENLSADSAESVSNLLKAASDRVAKQIWDALTSRDLGGTKSQVAFMDLNIDTGGGAIIDTGGGALNIDIGGMFG